MTTYGMERPAVMPMAAPVGAVTAGRHARRSQRRSTVHGTFAPFGWDQKPWTTGYDRQIGHIGREMTGRPARHLGRTST